MTGLDGKKRTKKRLMFKLSVEKLSKKEEGKKLCKVSTRRKERAGETRLKKKVKKGAKYPGTREKKEEN